MLAVRESLRKAKQSQRLLLRANSTHSNENKPNPNALPTPEQIQHFFGLGKRANDESLDRTEAIESHYKYPYWDQKHKLGIYAELTPQEIHDRQQEQLAALNATNVSTSSTTSGDPLLHPPLDLTPSQPQSSNALDSQPQSPLPATLAITNLSDPAQPYIPNVPQYAPLVEEEIKFPGVNTYPMEWILLAVVWAFFLIYSYFAMTDNRLEEATEELRWGGKAHQLHALNMLNRYMHFESIGVKVSYKILSVGLIEVILGTLNSRHEEVRTEAAKVLCKLSANDEVVKELNRLNALNDFRGKMSTNIYVLYLLGNMARNKEVALAMAQDEVLLEEAFYCLAFSQLRDDIADRWVERSLMRFFHNVLFLHDTGLAAITSTLSPEKVKSLDALLVSPRYYYDPYLLFYQFNLFSCIKDAKKNGFDAQSSFPLVCDLTDQEFMRPLGASGNLDIMSLALGSVIVGGLSYVAAQTYARGFQLKAFEPLTIPQKYWLKTTTLKVPAVAIGLFLFHHGLCAFVGNKSDDLFRSEYVVREQIKQASINSRSLLDEPPKPEGFRNQFAHDYGWQTTDTKGKSWLMLLHLTRIPIYFFAHSLVPYSLFTAVFPWRLKDDLPPVHVLNFLYVVKYIEERVIVRPSRADPTPADVERVLHGTAETQAAMIRKIKSMTAG